MMPHAIRLSRHVSLPTGAASSPELWEMGVISFAERKPLVQVCDLDACLTLLDRYAEEVERFSVVGYMGHL